ncbi:hypothetical protein [Calothrix sp. PCC 6303]|uniref:hypothetical protein n=1 Tax=Calothrix sp. PCC 6303 TaxID=1170562 RepID=UPI0002A057DA|nr:hypothetical protein [Calothrix sp. PCC 6303]AFZ03208.1 hypothetical protein Cal6303_4301 [Calothrix sp. PCC 6303]
MLDQIKIIVATVGILASQSPIYPAKIAASTPQSQSTEGICPGQNSSPRRSFETNKYQAYICLGDSKNPLGYYVRVTKSDHVKITVPLTRKNGDSYLAMRGEVGYVVSPYELVVLKHGRVVVQESVRNAASADGKSITQVCPEGENVMNEALTRSFIVYICGNNSPLNYIAIARSNNNRTIVPLNNSKSQGEVSKDKYIAIQGGTSYTLTRDVLRVSQNGQILIKEKVLRWN